jgi:hypothetical protein
VDVAIVEGVTETGEAAIEDTEAAVPFGEVEQEFLRSFEGATQAKAPEPVAVVEEAPAAEPVLAETAAGEN